MVRRLLWVALFVASFFGMGSPGAWAAPPAPNWMPSAPIMAGSQVILLWMPVPGAVKYNVYMNGTKIAEAVGVQHIVPAPEKPGEYTFELTAVDASGAESPKSRPGVIRIVKIEPPSNVAALVQGNQIRVRWAKADGAVIYNVYRAESEQGPFNLIASVQGESFADGKVEEGKTYFYMVSSKDLAGKESERSTPVSATVPKREQQAEVSITMRVVPSTEVSRIELLGPYKVKMYGGFKIGPDGYGYMVDAERGQVFRIDLEAGEVVAVIGEKGRGEGQLLQPAQVAFAADGTMYVSDYRAKVVAFSAKDEFLFEIPVPAPDPEKDKEVYDNALPNAKGSMPHPAGMAVDDENGILYVAVPAYNTIALFTLTGEFQEYLGRGGKGDMAMANPTELILRADRNELVVTEPPAHRVGIFDLSAGKRKATIGEKRKGFVGAFIGINGATLTPQGNLLFCDSGVHSIQVFDGETFDYLYHIGGAKPEADPEFHDRAKFDFAYPVGASFDRRGRLYIVNGLQRYISVREVNWDRGVDVP